MEVISRCMMGIKENVQHAVRQTERQRDRRTEGQTDRQTDSQPSDRSTDQTTTKMADKTYKGSHNSVCTLWLVLVHLSVTSGPFDQVTREGCRTKSSSRHQCSDPAFSFLSVKLNNEFSPVRQTFLEPSGI